MDIIVKDNQRQRETSSRSLVQRRPTCRNAARHHPIISSSAPKSSAMALSFVVPRASERESESNMWYYTPTFWNSRSYDNDETDNKTTEEVPLYVVKAPIYRMNDIFHREDERRKTFDKWPHDFIDKNQLAQTGMFFTGEDDKVKCYFCEVEIGEWQREDQPVAEHIRFSHNCPLLRRRTTNNVPISAEALDRALPPISYDICGANDAIEVRPHAYAEGTIAAPRMMTSTAINATGGLYGLAAAQSAGCSGTPQPMNYFPEFPEYAIEAARKRSFAEWPRHMNQKPEQLAEAGFFYTGIGDRVKCFSCGGGLKDWDISDEPWEQHALWLGRCRFLKLMKGQNFIDAVLSKQKEKDSPSSGDESSEDIAARAALNSAAPESAATAAVESSVAEQQVAAAAPASNVPADSTCRALSSDALQHETNVNAEEAATAPAAAAPAAAASGGDRRAPPAIAEEKLCKICYAAEYNTAFLPCGHVVACAKCASSVTKCPLCRKPFTDVTRVYFC